MGPKTNGCGQHCPNESFPPPCSTCDRSHMNKPKKPMEANGLPKSPLDTMPAGWMGIESAPKDGTKVVAWFVPNEVNAPDKAKPRVASWQMKQFKDGNGKKIGKPFGMWEGEEGCGPMSYAPTHWMPKPL